MGEEKESLLLSTKSDPHYYRSMSNTNTVDDEEAPLPSRSDANDEEAISLVASLPNGRSRSRQERRSPSPSQRRQRDGLMRGPIGQPSSSFMGRLTFLSVVTLMVIGSVGLLTYLQDSKAPKFQYIPGTAEQQILLSDGSVLEHARGDHSSLSSEEALAKLMKEAGLKDTTYAGRPPQIVRYDPKVTQYNPFEFQNKQAQPLAPQLTGGSVDDISNARGYIQMPHLVKNQLVFCSQGDVFITRVVDPDNHTPQKALPATKLTTTVGNVLDPRLHPNLRYLAYTATYSGRRDIYLLDLQGGKPAVRLTYWDASAGVNGLVGWWGESSLVFRAMSNEVSLPDYRLYVLHLEDQKEGVPTMRNVEELGEIAPTKEKLEQSVTADARTISMLQIDPVPLSQAREAARYQDCWYFVRYAQSSNTIRYVGGTAEQLYRYCDNAETTDRLFFQDQYNGTSKAPQMYMDSNYLFFLSDRGRRSDGSWQPDRMNVWALSITDDIQDHTADSLIQITDVSCDFEGRAIREYSIDPATGHMVVRIGADLYFMNSADIQTKLKGGSRQLLKTDEDILLRDDNNATEADDTIDPELTVDESETEALDVAVNETNETLTQVYYNYEPPQLQSRFAADTSDHVSGSAAMLSRLPIVVHSDFHTHQERIIPVDLLDHMTSADIYETAVGTLSFVTTLRGQLWVLPVEQDSDATYGGSGRNIPERRYRVAPGNTMGGSVRILAVLHVPNPVEDDVSDRRLAVILATDPLSETAEHAFYLIETQTGATPLFIAIDRLPKPFLGGHLSGGSTMEGGLGSIDPTSLQISPCGRRMAWTDRDGRIVAMNLPQYQDLRESELPKSTVLPKENELGEPLVGENAVLVWSPGGRYLAIEHNARNQFSIISIADLGDPQGQDEVADIELGRIVQATPSRFNSVSPYWSKSPGEMHAFSRDTAMASLLGAESPPDVATTLFYLSDRDIATDVRSPWGTRQPMPHFKKQKSVFALPLSLKNVTKETDGPYAGAGATEARTESILARQQSIKASLSARRGRRELFEDSLSGAFGIANKIYASRELEEEREGETENELLRTASFSEDMDIEFGEEKDFSLKFARQAYRVATIPEGNFISILSHTPDDGSFAIVAIENDNTVLTVYVADGYPSDQYTPKTFAPVGRKLASYGKSTCGKYLFLVFSPDGQTRVVENTALGLSRLLIDSELDDNIVSASSLHLSIWPSLEYRQLYDDAWRMLRDYYYDPDLTGIDWPAIHSRYLPLLVRCAKREELDDVLVQMASELSALHVFVYGGEKDSPSDGHRAWARANDVASLGATLKRVPEWKGYQIISIAESDPDFGLIDGATEIYSPLSDKTLKLSGQRGLLPGDVIVGVNGESVMNVPDLHMLLRGQAGSSVRLDVLRITSGENQQVEEVDGEVPVEPLIVVPIDAMDADDLRYYAWEWKTRQLAEHLATDNGFSVGYIHLQDMSGPAAENAFARGFFPNYHKDALILDVRHNRGGNIDSWVLDVLQRKAWMYWQSRDFTANNGGLGWDEQFAFRGHIVVLIDEKTSSDGEGVSRGISELGLGRLIGTRTWGGGIWLASDNHLVDGGIATAPEIGTYNDHFGWGLGIEQMGVDPDIVVDNDPRQSYAGKDTQLETAIQELKEWLKAEPILTPQPPLQKREMSMGERECTVAS